MFKTFLCAAAFSALTFSASAATVTNGDFETGDFTGWVVGATGNGETAFSEVGPFDASGDGISDAATFRVGQVDFDAGVFEGITLTQTLSILTAGTYSFAADVAAMGGSTFNQSGGLFELFIGGTLIDSFDVGRISLRSVVRETLEGELFLDTGDTDLAIRIARPFLQAESTPTQFVDNVTAERLTPVPLPAGLPLLVIAFGSLVVIRRNG